MLINNNINYEKFNNTVKNKLVNMHVSQLIDNQKDYFVKKQTNNINFNGLNNVTKFFNKTNLDIAVPIKKNFLQKLKELIKPAKKAIKPLKRPFVTGNKSDNLSESTKILKSLKNAGIDISDVTLQNNGKIDSISKSILERDVVSKFKTGKVAEAVKDNLVDKVRVPYGADYMDNWNSIHKDLFFPKTIDISDITPKSTSEIWLEKGMKLKEAGKLDEQIEFFENNRIGPETDDIIDTLKSIRAR